MEDLHKKISVYLRKRGEKITIFPKWTYRQKFGVMKVISNIEIDIPSVKSSGKVKL